jgi:hypothetical protein
MAAVLAFLLDVDNTLLDNDRAKRDLQAHLEQLIGPERGDRFWGLDEEVRREFDSVDCPLRPRSFQASFRVGTRHVSRVGPGGGSHRGAAGVRTCRFLRW